MIKYQDLKIKLDEFVTLLEVAEADVAVKLKEIDNIESVKNSIEGAIKKNQSILDGLSARVEEANKNIKLKQDEASYLKGIYETKIQAIDEKMKSISSVETELLNRSEELENAKLKYEQKELEARSKLDEAKALREEYQNKIDLLSSAEIKIEENKNSIRIESDKLSKRSDDVNKLEVEVKQLLSNAESIKIENESKYKSILKLSSDLESKRLELESKRIAIDSDAVDLLKRKQALDVQELRINKIIREKNIEALVNVK